MISQHTDHGFYDTTTRGTMVKLMVDKIFATACQIVKEVYQIERDDDVVALMDSSWGRHTADITNQASSPEEMRTILLERLPKSSARSMAKRVLLQIERERAENPQLESAGKLVSTLLEGAE